MPRLKLYIIGLLLLGYSGVIAQQSHSQFLIHEVQQSNLLNPAIPISCKWYVGIPVLSLIHTNYSNSSFSYNDIFSKAASGAFQPNVNQIVNNLHWRNSVSTEVQTQLFALGYKYQSYSIVFSVAEKDNSFITFPEKAILLGLQGNAPFIGEKVGLKGTSVYFNHYREYAIGVSKDMNNGTYFGVRAKLLFGKLNVSTQKSDIGIYTDPTTFNLNFDGQALVNSSLPIIVDASNNTINSIVYNDAVSPTALILNRKNPGIALDIGVIYPLNEKIELSASALDLGFIHWRSNLNTFDITGKFDYLGMDLNSINTNNYFGNLGNAFRDSMKFTVYPKKYTTFLPPRFMAGANYTIFPQLTAGLVGNLIIYRTKTLPSLTLVGQYKPFNNLGLMGSYTIQNYSFNSVGAGLYIGHNPVQFYMVTDNLMAAFKPLTARNVNLRFGLNINLGCGKKEKSKSLKARSNNACFGYGNSQNKAYMKKFVPWNKRRK